MKPRGPVQERSLLSVIRGNRKALRLRGLSAADILFLESAAAMLTLRKARSLSVAALGRMSGISRQAAHVRAKRLEAAGAMFRVGKAVMLNIRGLLSWAAEAVQDRLAAVKRCYDRKKALIVNPLLTHRGLSKDQGESDRASVAQSACLAVVGTVADNLAALRAVWREREQARIAMK